MNIAIFPINLVKYIVKKPHKKYKHKQDKIMIEIDTNYLSVVCFAMEKHLYNETGFNVQNRLNSAKFKELKQSAD